MSIINGTNRRLPDSKEQKYAADMGFFGCQSHGFTIKRGIQFMPHSTSKTPVRNLTMPEKPDPDFPLFAHNNRMWAEWIKCMMVLFWKLG